MNFKMKTLAAAALATVAMSSGSAFAIDNGELFLTAYNATTQQSFIAALNGSIDTFNLGANASYAFAGDTNWNTFKGDANFSNVTFKVGAFVTEHGASPTLYQNARVLTTSPDLAAIYSGQNDGSIGWGFNWVQAVDDNAGPQGRTRQWQQLYNADVTGTSTKLLVGAGDGTDPKIGNNWFDNLGFGIYGTHGAVGADLPFYMLNGDQVDIEQSMVATNVGSWKLTNAGLTFTTSAVPEANTWALMLAGLGLMSFVARRRA